MIQKSNMERVLKVFFEDPEKKFNLKEVSIELNLAHTSVKRELNLLIKKNLIRKENEKRGKRNFPIYLANLNEEFFYAKKISNEEEIINSGLVDFLVKETFPNSIVLFGSYSRGEDLKGSDIDLFAESSFKELDLIKFKRKLKRRVSLLFKKDINELKKETINNIINGRILYGVVKIK